MAQTTKNIYSRQRAVFLPLSLFLSPPPPLSPSLPLSLSRLQSDDIDAAVSLRLGNTRALAPSEGRSGSKARGFSLSAVGNVAFINTILAHNKPCKYTETFKKKKTPKKRNNSRNSWMIHQKNVVREFVWCSFVANLWSLEWRINVNVKQFELAQITGRRSVYAELNSRITQGWKRPRSPFTDSRRGRPPEAARRARVITG